jgi:hypothetical protein
MKTVEDLKQLVARPDNPGTIVLSVEAFDAFAELAEAKPVTRTPEGPCYFRFGGTQFERVVKPVLKLYLADQDDWVESPLVSPPAPEVRKGARRKKAYKAAEVFAEDIKDANFESNL